MSVRHSDAADQDLLGATDDLKKEYIKHMIELVREDMKMVMIYVAAFLAIVATVTTKIPIPTLAALTFPEKLVMALGVVAAMSAALLYFYYVRQLHLVQMFMTRALASLDVVTVRHSWSGPKGVWQKHKGAYRLAAILGVISIVCVTAVFLMQLFAGIPKP